MIKNILTFIFILLATFQLSAQDAVLFHIDETPVKVSEFEYIYNKNNFDNKANYSEQSLREYLDLYINFRLKVKEAESMGLHEDAKLQSELKVYQQQLYNSFYDKNTLDQLVDEAQERLKEDISVSHIYVAKQQQYGAPDANSRKKIDEAYAALQNGMNFKDAVQKFSEDHQSIKKDGNLGFFTALIIAFYNFENATYNTPIGEYSEVVETPIGYHIIRVNEKRPARGLAKVAIIKLIKKPDVSQNATLRKKADNIYAELLEGGNFSTLAITFSEDINTKNTGGEMDYFGIAQYDIDFEDQVFALKNKGDISKPFETKNAIYIVKLLDKKAYVESEIDREKLISRIKKSERYQLKKSNHVRSILEKYGFKENEANLRALRFKALDKFNKNEHKIDIEKPQFIIQIADKQYTDKDLAAFIYKNNSKFNRLKNDQRFEKLYDLFLEEKAIDFHILAYGDENQEYGALLQEYRDGILLFDLMEKKVWSKAVEDSTGLEDFYAKNKAKFVAPEQAEVRKFTVPNAKSAKLLSKFLKIDPDLQKEKYLIKLDKKGVSSTFEVQKVVKGGENANNINWEVNGTKTITSENRAHVYQTIEIEPERQRAFEDSKGFVIAAYQEYLEKEWLKSLKNKYKIVVDETVLKSLVK